MDFPNARFTVLSKQIRKNNQLLNPHTCSASLKPAIVHDGTVVFEIESTVIKRNFNVSLLKDEQKESAVHLLQLKDVKILPTKFEESLMYQFYTAKEMQMVLFFQSFFQCASVAVLIVLALKLFMKEQLEEMEELRIPSIVLSTKDDMLLLIRGAN